MGELGKISGVVHSGAAAIGPAQYAASGLARTSATGIAGNDAGAATIRSAARTQTAGVRQDIGGADIVAPWAEMMRDFVQAVREKVAELTELLEQIATGRFSSGNLAKNLQEQAEAIGNTLDAFWEDVMVTSISATGTPSPSAGSGPRVHTDAGQLLTTFQEELEQINAFDGFLLGVHEKIEQFKTPAEFGLNQVEDVEQNMTETNAKLDLGIFSLARVREQAMRTLRCQDLEPGRVLFLLQDPLRADAQQTGVGPRD